ncbi:MAG: NAD(P)H-quinone oxidoreductase [Devosia sp.]
MSVPHEMTAIAITAPGGPEMLRPVRHAIPALNPGEVLIRVAAAGLNAPDLGQRRGTYAPPPGASPLPGLEVAGEVAALGAGTANLQLGERVVALTNGGGYAEYVAVPAGQVLPLPRGWSPAEGATLPETFFTIEQTLVLRAGLSVGMWVLIHGAAGGIGGTAIQVSRLHGARPIAVVSSAEKAAYALSLGAEAVIRHDEEDFVTRTMALTAEHGADRVIDMVAGENLDRNIAASARFGHIVLLATAGGGRAEINAARLMMKQMTLSGSTLRPQSSDVKAAIAHSLRQNVWPALEDGRIRKPRIQRFALADAPDAHRALEARSNYGKIVLITDFERGQAD